MKKTWKINLGKREYNGVGDLNLKDTQITSLPEELSVGGSLYLRGTQIKKSEVPKKLIKKCIW